MEMDDQGLKVGAMVTMAQLQDFVKAQVASLPGRYSLCIKLIYIKYRCDKYILLKNRVGGCLGMYGYAFRRA